MPRGGVYVRTVRGPIQFGMPPETIKDVMSLGLSMPVDYFVPKERFDLKLVSRAKEKGEKQGMSLSS